MTKDFSKLEKKLGIKFKNKKILQQALVHRSYLNEHPDFALGHNERLEFLGDAVLELAVTKYLFEKYNRPEGELTNLRASLVNTKSLAKIAKNLDFNHLLCLSKGETKDKESRARESILANTFEALVGAIYLDQGITKVKTFLERVLFNKLPEILKKKLYLDPKTRFQEVIQRAEKITPIYRVLKDSGPDHAKVFEVGVFVKGQLMGQGEGKNKQEAETEAARQALQKI
jgi:ribonuclease-3